MNPKILMLERNIALELDITWKVNSLLTSDILISDRDGRNSVDTQLHKPSQWAVQHPLT
jgi:hypothetical protein